MSQPSHIVLVHRYYSPDTPPYAAILKQIAERCGSKGAEVTVLTCQPSYNRSVVSRAAKDEYSSGVRVRRCPVLDDRASGARKALNLLIFSGWLGGQFFKLQRPTHVMAASTPPVAVAAVSAALARLRGAKFTYHHQDIWPEVLRPQDPITHVALRVLRTLDARTDRRADNVVVLSLDMAKTIAARTISPASITVLNNFDPWDIQSTHDGAVRGEGSRLRVLYAGNIGPFQGMDDVFQALRETSEDPIDWVFVGAGSRLGELKDIVRQEQLPHVQVHDYMPPDELARLIRETADVGLVSLAPGVIDCAYPSKTLSYLRNGLPVLSIVEGQSQLATQLRDSGAGWTCAPGQPEHLVATLREIATERPSLRAACSAASNLYASTFSKERALDHWAEILTS